MAEIHNFIDGEYVLGHGEQYANFYPPTGEEFASIRAADQEQVAQAVGAARSALKGPWGTMSVPQRTALLRKLADRINERFDEFLAAEIRDTGKPTSIASHIDIPRGAANFNIFADQVATTGTEAFEMPTPDGAGAINYALRLPRGVIAVICPWNLPLLLMTWKVAPALACGNTVVVKPSEQTPATATLLGEVMNEVGIPRGVYNVVHGHGPGSAGEFLTTHPDVDGITFTGETRTGEAIMRAAATGVRPVSLELGGKNAGVIFDDADFDKTMEGIARACSPIRGRSVSAPNASTSSVASSTASPKDSPPGRVATASAIRSTPPPPWARRSAPSISRRCCPTTTRPGMPGPKSLAGGGKPDLQGFEGGYWVEPTVWTGLSERDPVVTDEIFGPCTHLCPFDDEEEAIALANDTPYGLATSIWTENLSRAHRVAGRIEVGISWVNCWFLRDLRTPFGGSKASGIGREGGVHSMEFYTELRNVCVKL